MRYICCVWLCIVWLVCHAQTRVYGLHIQQAPEIIQRITRQATRYGSAGGGVSGGVGPNYRPVASQVSNYNVRNAVVDSSSALSHQLSGNSGQRTVGVGGFSFGGMASGRPTNGNSFAVNSAAAHGKVVNNPIKVAGVGGGGAGAVIRPQPQPNQAIVGKPNQLQQALLQAAQFQLQQKQQYQQQQQQQQLRRQVPQQVYRQRPAPNYQQFN